MLLLMLILFFMICTIFDFISSDMFYIFWCFSPTWAGLFSPLHRFTSKHCHFHLHTSLSSFVFSPLPPPTSQLNESVVSLTNTDISRLVSSAPPPHPTQPISKAAHPPPPLPACAKHTALMEPSWDSMREQKAKYLFFGLKASRHTKIYCFSIAFWPTGRNLTRRRAAGRVLEWLLAFKP